MAQMGGLPLVSCEPTPNKPQKTLDTQDPKDPSQRVRLELGEGDVPANGFCQGAGDLRSHASDDKRLKNASRFRPYHPAKAQTDRPGKRESEKKSDRSNR